MCPSDSQMSRKASQAQTYSEIPRASEQKQNVGVVSDKKRKPAKFGNVLHQHFQIQAAISKACRVLLSDGIVSDDANTSRLLADKHPAASPSNQISTDVAPLQFPCDFDVRKVVRPSPGIHCP